MFLYLFFGAIFGFILSRIDATNYTTISEMFQLKDLHLIGVLVIAILFIALGFSIIRRRKQYVIQGQSVSLQIKPRKAGNIIGSIFFGVGWALTGSCPGTALAQLGEGKLLALFTLSGILIGAELHRRLGKKMELALSIKRKNK